MTVKKLSLTQFTIVAIISVSLTAFVITVLSDVYLRKAEDLSDHNMELNVIRVVEEQAVNGDANTMNLVLSTMLGIPIHALSYYDADGVLVAEANNAIPSPPQNTMQKKEHGIYAEPGGTEIGKLVITFSYKPIPSFFQRLLYSSLLRTYMLALLAALATTVALGLYFSSRLTKALEETAKMAGNLLVDEDTKLKRSNIDEIETIRGSLDNLNNRLRVKQKSRKTLVDELIHQTRTPLTILQMHLEAIEDGILTLDDKEMQTFSNEISNLTTIISSIGGMIDANKEIENPVAKEFLLSSLVSSVTCGMQPQFAKKNIALSVESNKAVKLKTDANILSQILYNLVTNALKYTPSNGKVTIGYAQEGKNLQLWVADTGIGISKEEQKHIFEAYFRSREVADLKGEGIGLFLVAEKAKALQGTIAVESTVHKGSVFTLTIPLHYQNEVATT
jgi:signal transduction histidine kinase